jgi:hypothetical protein
MIVVKIELHSAIDHTVSEIGRMYIVNTGNGTQEYGDYHTQIMRKGVQSQSGAIWKIGYVRGHARKRLSVWTLIVKAIGACMGGKAI